MNKIALCNSLLLAVLLMFPGIASAIPAITCHCFTDRSYDPARPTLADPYFLANAQNSFFASIFNVDKKSLVMKKQKGSSSDDLWVAYGISARSNVAPDVLLRAKETKGTWHEAAESAGVAPKVLGTRLAAALQRKAPPPALAEAAADDVILRYRLLDESELAALRKAGASNQELFSAILAADRLKQPPRQLFATVRSGGKSWGKLFTEAGLDASTIPVVAAALVRPPR